MESSPCAGRSGFRSDQAREWTTRWTEEVAGRSDLPLVSCFVPTRYGATHVLRSASSRPGPEIVCLPGWGTTGGFWALSGGLESLGACGRVSLVDMPGQPGLSEGCPPLYTSSEQVARWAGDLLDGLGVERAHLVGMSMGGALALQVARGAPERVGRIVLCAPAGIVLPLPGPRPLLALLAHRFAPSRPRTARFYSACVLGPDQEIAQDARRQVDEALFRFAGGFANGSRPLIRLRDDELREVSHDVLLLVGERDPVFSPRGTVARASRLLAGLTRWEVLESHGHALDVSPRVARLAARFLAEAPE